MYAISCIIESASQIEKIVKDLRNVIYTNLSIEVKLKNSKNTVITFLFF